MTKADLVEQIAEATGLTKKDTAVVVDGFLEAVKQALARESNIEIRGFGSSGQAQESRKARNPRTGTRLRARAAGFRPSSPRRS